MLQRAMQLLRLNGLKTAAERGELWKKLYPDDHEHPYTLLKTKMTYLDISKLAHEQSVDMVLTI